MSALGHRERRVASAVPVNMEVGVGPDHNPTREVYSSGRERLPVSFSREGQASGLLLLSSSSHVSKLSAPSDTLRSIQQYEVLDRLRRAARSQRMAAFRGEVAIVINNLNVRICDCLMVFLRGDMLEAVTQRHTETAAMLHLLTELCQRPSDIGAWGYSEQQSAWLFERLELVVGVGRSGQIRPHQFAAVPVGTGPAVDSPILFPLLCALLSPDLLLIPLARMPAAARRGRWSADDRVFVVHQSARSREALGPMWEVLSADFADLGDVRVVVRGNHIQWVELGVPWPAVQRPSGSHFLPVQCQLELVHTHSDLANRNGLINVPAHDGAYITMAIDAWERRLGSLSLELRSLLEGTYRGHT